MQRYPGRATVAQLILAAAVLIVAGWFIYDRFFKTDEARIRELIQSAADGARERRPSGITRTLADDFRGPEEVDKDLVHGWCVSVLVAQYKVVEPTLTPQPLEVKFIDPKNATVDLRAGLRAKVDEAASWDELPRRYGKAAGVPLRLTLNKGDDGWKIKALEVLPETDGNAGAKP
ncbi:MAG TPA: hypothetical protein VEJ63_12505 [Planctomycetota bacterium]|nr:hypothetical protein [Planctomycetota bacterium]